MIDERDVFEKSFRRYEPEGGSFERLIRRRDRKRRNQRIVAGVVGVAVFVAAIWIVIAGGAFDRSETPAVPGPAETRPAAQASVGTVTFDGSTCSIEFTADRIEPGVVVFDIVNARGAPTTFDAWKLMDGYTFREFERAVEKAAPAPGERRQEAFPGEPKIAYLASEYSPSNGSGTLVTTMSPGTHAIVCLTAIDLRAFDIFMRPVGIAGPIVVGTGQTETGPAVTAPPSAPASAAPDVVEQEMCSDGARVRLELTNIGRVTGLFSSMVARFELHRSPVGHEWRILIERFSGMDPPIVWMRGTRVASDSGDLVVQRSSFQDGMLRVWFRAKALDRQTGQVCTVSATAARRE